MERHTSPAHMNRVKTEVSREMRNDFEWHENEKPTQKHWFHVTKFSLEGNLQHPMLTREERPTVQASPLKSRKRSAKKNPNQA